jgi:death-on-curing protein
VKRGLRFLTAEQVVALHDALLRRWGGAAGGGHRGAAYEGVDAAIQVVRNSYYDAVEELAAAYAVYIVQGHVFLDGNKRTGAAAMRVFLEVNGSAIRPPSLETAARMVELQARSEAGETGERLILWLADWLRTRATRARGARGRGKRGRGQ